MCRTRSRSAGRARSSRPADPGGTRRRRECDDDDDDGASDGVGEAGPLGKGQTPIDLAGWHGIHPARRLMSAGTAVSSGNKSRRRCPPKSVRTPPPFDHTRPFGWSNARHFGRGSNARSFRGSTPRHNIQSETTHCSLLPRATTRWRVEMTWHIRIWSLDHEPPPPFFFPP